MSLRERIADFISGGQLSEDRLTKQLALETIQHWQRKASTRRQALSDIIAADTPGGNGTVKRMVRIARKGLE